MLLRIATIVVALGIALSARGLVQSQPRPTLPPVRTSLHPDYVRIASLSFDSIAADIFWIRFLQQLPMRPADDALGASLASQLQIVVALDPQFREAHLEGGTLLSVLGNQHCAALEISERGMKRFPHDWRLAFQAGYICFSELRDSGCAARHMRTAAEGEDAPKWLPRLVGRLLAEDSQLDAAIDYLASQAQREKDPRVREHVEERLREGLLTRDLQRLEEAVRAYRVKRGELPPDWAAIVAEGLLPAPPGKDAFGGTLELGSDGRVRSTSGRKGLETFRIDDGWHNTPREKIAEERVEGRLAEWIGDEGPRFGPMERLRAAAGDVSVAPHALEAWRAVDPGSERRIRLLEGRVLMRLELERLRAAHLRLLQRDPDRTPSMAEVAREAGVRPHDPFGDAYGFDDAGQPVTASGREPISVFRGVLAKGSVACP